MTDRVDCQPGSAQWDAICKRCGRCCYERLDDGEQIIETGRPCRYLDPQTQLCQVYPKRFELCPDCTQITPDIIRSGLLPQECGYVIWLNDWAGET